MEAPALKAKRDSIARCKLSVADLYPGAMLQFTGYMVNYFFVACDAF